MVIYMENKVNNIVVPENVLSGNYCNLGIFSHSSSEFVLDFAQNVPGMAGPVVRDRIILSPDNAKRILLALRENIEKYESAYGEIHVFSPIMIPTAGVPQA